MVEISEKVNPALLLTGAIGIATKEESSSEIVKKCILQGKPNGR